MHTTYTVNGTITNGTIGGGGVTFTTTAGGLRCGEIGRPERVIEYVPEQDPVPRENGNEDVPDYIPQEWVPEPEPIKGQSDES